MHYSVVGAGLTGLTAARILADAGHDVEVFEMRDHIGGNCADGPMGPLHGPHIFHTSDDVVWGFMQRFATWIPTEHRVVADTDEGRFALPYWGSLSDEDIVRLCFDGYTRKQWGKSWAEMPDSVVARVPLRDRRQRYFTDEYEGMPDGGYSAMFNRMAGGLSITLNCHAEAWRIRTDRRVLYTGRLDDIFYGPRLPYRSLWFQDIPRSPGAFVVNECRAERPYLRTVDYSMSPVNPVNRVVREFPAIYTGSAIPYYPVDSGKQRQAVYREMAYSRNIVCLGRLADYKYYDMDKAVARAMSVAQKE